VSADAVIRNQKRQMIGQTILHVLVDQELKRVAPEHSDNFAAFLKKREQEQPDWLKVLIGEHMRRVTFFWEIFPDVLSFRFKRLARLSPLAKLRAFPAAMIGFLVTLLSSWLAYRFLKKGYTSYWPDTRSQGLKNLSVTTTPQPAG
jgi:hypothetical protein